MSAPNGSENAKATGKPKFTPVRIVVQFDSSKSHDKLQPIARNKTVHIAAIVITPIMEVSCTSFYRFYCDLHRLLLI